MLYKYFSFNENSISCLINNEIWMSSLREFNDPFESLVSVDFGNEELQKLFEAYIQKKVVFCFSECNKNILMWSHYADKHKGFCIGVDESRFLKHNLLSKVIYKELDPNIKDEILKISRTNASKAGKVYEKLITHKHKDWEYEKEQRVILESRDPSSAGRTFKLLDGQIKEIYFGCNMAKKHKDLIIKIMGDKVSYYQTKTSKMGFSLEMEEVIPTKSNS